MLGLIEALGTRGMNNTLNSTYKPVITVAEARKLLGSDSKPLTDTQIQELITFLTLLARNYLRSGSSKKY